MRLCGPAATCLRRSVVVRCNDQEIFVKKKTEIQWLDQSVPHDDEAAEQYLQFLLEPKQARVLGRRLKRAPMAQYAAKDILKASGTSIFYQGFARKASAFMPGMDRADAEGFPSR